MSARLVFISALLLAPLSVRAADLPKQGVDSYTTFYVTTSFNTMKMGDRTITNYDTSGVSRNDSGGDMFNNMSVRCLGTAEVVGNEPINRGSCVDMDSGGDQVFSNYEAKGAKGTHTFVGGTGKYSGMSGTADYTFQPVKSSDGRGMAAVAHKATWKLLAN